MTTYFKTKHFKLIDAQDVYKDAEPGRLACIQDETAKDCCVEVRYSPWRAQPEDIEEVYVSYGLLMDGSKIRKDEYISSVADCLDDALLFKKKMLDFLDDRK